MAFTKWLPGMLSIITDKRAIISCIEREHCEENAILSNYNTSK